MVRLQHISRRDGGITVESTHYLLDSEGIVEVSEIHAEMLARVGTWKPVILPDIPASAKEKSTLDSVDLASQNKAKPNFDMQSEVKHLAAQPNPFVPPSFSKKEKEIEEEIELEISKNTSLEELKSIAKQLGLKFHKNVTQAQLFEIISSQGS